MDDLSDHLTATTKGLTYPSESDEPFEIVSWSTAATAGEAVANNVKKRPIKFVDVAQFFDGLREDPQLGRFDALRGDLEQRLSDLAAIRAGGGPEIDVYLIGRGPSGWVGLKTMSVET